MLKSLDVDDVVAGVRDKAGHAFWPESGGDTGGEAAPVVAGQDGALNAKDVNEIDQVFAKRSLLPGTH